SYVRTGPLQELHSFPTRRSSDLTGTPPLRGDPGTGGASGVDRIQDLVHGDGVDGAPGDPIPGGNKRFDADEYHRNRCAAGGALTDRKSTRLNSSHVKISYAVFCL